MDALWSHSSVDPHQIERYLHTSPLTQGLDHRATLPVLGAHPGRTITDSQACSYHFPGSFRIVKSMARAWGMTNEPAIRRINNAAYLAVGGVEAVALAEWRAVIETNLTGAFLGKRAAAPSMRKGGGGSIVNISSIAGLHGTPGLAAYGASKWGIRSLTRTAAYELARDGIRVNSVHPGIIDTPLAYDPKTGLELVPVDDFAIPRMASVDEIAAYVLFVASDEAAFSTGSEFVADGGFALGAIAEPR